MYAATKWLHVFCVAASGSLFVLRGWWMWHSPDKLDRLWVRSLPHIIDTLLLASGVTLVVVTGLYPWQQAWLAVKMGALVLYILLGLGALRLARGRGAGKAAWVLAVLAFCYMVAVATTKSPGLTAWSALS